MTTPADNILQGPAHLYVARWTDSTGPNLPGHNMGTTLAEDIAGFIAGYPAMGWESVGMTTKALDVVDTPTYIKAHAQQTPRALDVAVSEIATTFKTGMRNITVQRLLDMTRGTQDPTSNVITPSGIGSVPKFALALVGPWPGGDNCVVVADRCVFTNAQTLSFDTSKHTEIDIEIEVLESFNLPGGYEIIPAISSGS